MLVLFRFIVFLLFLIAGVVWLTKVQPVFATSASSPLFSVPLQNETAGAIAAETDNAPLFNGDGVVLVDTTEGAPGVPYIVYETPKQGFAMKSLIFNIQKDEPCQVSAGELPCTRDINGNDPSESDASPVPSGTPIHLVGEVDEQAVIVDSYDTLSQAPAGMLYASIPFGVTATTTSTTTIMPISVADNASCTLGVGCFGNGVQRLSMTITSGKSSTNTEMVPGTIFRYGNATIILLSVTDSKANFLLL